MNNTIEMPQSNNQFVKQFNRAVLDYEIFILEERQKKQARLKTREKFKKFKNVDIPSMTTSFRAKVST